MYVDDIPVGQTRLANGDARIAALRDGASGGLFLGGVRTGEDHLGMAASLQPLAGCLYGKDGWFQDDIPSIKSITVDCLRVRYIFGKLFTKLAP